MAKDQDLDINYITQLARLELTDDEKSTFAEQLHNILGHFEKLAAVDVEGVEPTAHPFPSNNVWENDTPQTPFTPEQALMNAPSQQDNQIIVPKIVD